MRPPTKRESARENAQINARIAEENRLRDHAEELAGDRGNWAAILDLFPYVAPTEVFADDCEAYAKERIKEETDKIEDEIRKKIAKEVRAEVTNAIRAEFAEKIDDAEWTEEQNTRLAAENAALRAKLKTYAELPSTPRRRQVEIRELRQKLAELTAEIAKLRGAKEP